MPKTERGINLGGLQSQYEKARREARAAERALTRAEDARDNAAAKLADLTAALKTATRAVLGGGGE